MQPNYGLYNHGYCYHAAIGIAIGDRPAMCDRHSNTYSRPDRWPYRLFVDRPGWVLLYLAESNNNANCYRLFCLFADSRRAGLYAVVCLYCRSYRYHAAIGIAIGDRPAMRDRHSNTYSRPDRWPYRLFVDWPRCVLIYVTEPNSNAYGNQHLFADREQRRLLPNYRLYNNSNGK